MTVTDFESIILHKKPVFLSGIGGVSMRAMADLLLSMGADVRGSDRDASPYTERFQARGISVFIGQKAENLQGDEAVLIRSAAVLDSNPEIQAARAHGIPVIERGQAWGLLMQRYQNVVCISGTHGKTSTTSMTATFAMSAGLDPTVMVGGELSSIGGSLRIGSHNLFVAEACEYKNSYHSFAPSIAVILNIDRDHLDFFSDTDDIIASFRHFASLVPQEGGVVIANGDDANTRRAIAGLERRVVTFGKGESCDVRPENIKYQNGFYSFDIVARGAPYCRVNLSVPGEHNLLNALACAAVALELRVPPAAFSAGIASYCGVGRRFESKGLYRGALLFDDYAHHPSEIEATLRTARSMKPSRVICIFQPHTYSRTISLRDEFARALALSDICVLTDIYASREVNTTGINSHYLADLIPGSVCVNSFDEARAYVRQNAAPGDLIFTMGAGDVWKIFQNLPEN